MIPSDHPKGDPKIISETEGEEITPDNPEIVKQYPVPNTKEAHEEVEDRTKDSQQ